MRDYLSPAKRYMSRVMTHPSALSAFVAQKRALVFALTASFVVIMTLGFVTVRGLMLPTSENKNIVTKEGETSQLTSITTNSNSNSDQPAMKPQESQSTNVTAQSSSDGKTSVTVNNQPIDVPENGSVSKTITNENGTTQVNISTNSDSSGNSVSSSVSSTNLNTSTNSFSQNVSISSQ